ncbi:MAG: hypothetical protein AAB652_01695 [Patescibacteria group bacterium]
MKTGLKDTIKIISVPVVIASLCCLSPVILVLFGLSTAAFASSLADTLYGEYKWLFRVIGFILLAGSIILYLRRQKGICTLNEAKKHRNEIINIVLISVSAAVIGYLIWLYVIVEYVGKLLSIWK